MLMNILPGIRDLRAPLAAGYIWVINVWLVFGEKLPRGRPPSGLTSQVWDLALLVGKPVVLAAVTFTAYVIGSFLERDPVKLSVNRKLQFLLQDYDRAGMPFDSREAHHLEKFVRGLLYEKGGTRLDHWVGAMRSGGPNSTLYALAREIPYLATQLQVKNSDLFGKYDKLMSEATIRMNLALPATILIGLLALLSDLPLFLRLILMVAGLVFGILLFRQGNRRAVEGFDTVVQALTLGIGLTSHTLASYVEEADRQTPKTNIQQSR